MASSSKWPEITQAIEKSKRDLKLSGDNVAKRVLENQGEVDSSLYQLSDLLNKLEISAVNLQSLSSDIAKLKGLKELVLSNNKLTTLPQQLGELIDLKILIAVSNQITILPENAFGKLKSLQVLNLSGNLLTSIPEDFKLLEELVTLNLGNNRLTTFPKSITKLPRLATLMLNHNQINQMQLSFEDLSALQTLDMSNNQLIEVPDMLGTLHKLKDVNLLNNPFKDKKFVKLVESGKPKNVLQQLKKNAPKPSKEEEPVKVLLAKILTERTHQVEVGVSQKDIRPFIIMVVIRNVTFNDRTFKQFIDLQTEIHQTLCKRRTLAALGTHDLSSVKSPFLWDAVHPKKICFVPLKEETPIIGDELKAHFEKKEDSSMLKYLSIITNKQIWPVLFDNTHEVLCLPPVINSRYSQITTDTRDILIECTSSENITICKEAMDQLLGSFIRIMKGSGGIGDQLELEQVQVVSHDGHVRLRYPTQKDLEDITDRAEAT